MSEEAGEYKTNCPIGSLAMNPVQDFLAEITNDCVMKLDRYTATRAPMTIAQWRDDIREIIRETVDAAWFKDLKWRYHNDAAFQQFVERIQEQTIEAYKEHHEAWRTTKLK